jgi:hypothetical protein
VYAHRTRYLVATTDRATSGNCARGRSLEARARCWARPGSTDSPSHVLSHERANRQV